MAVRFRWLVLNFWKDQKQAEGLQNRIDWLKVKGECLIVAQPGI